MRDPNQYPGAMAICQAGVTVVYAVIGCVVYYYCGSYVSSPALSSAGPLIKIISYAFALPGLLVTMTIVSHVRLTILKRPVELNNANEFQLRRSQRNSSSCISSAALAT